MKYEKRDLLELYKIKTEEHWYTLYNPILKYLGNLTGKKILDLGCGSGILADKLSDSAKQVIGVDISQSWIDQCHNIYRQKNLTFFQSSATNLQNLKTNSFDIVIINMVLPNVYKITDVENIFQEVKRITKTNGVLVFSDLHPICKMTKIEGPRKQKYSKNFSYFKEGSKFSAIVTLPNKKDIEFEDAHWSLGFYTNVLAKNNYVIEKIIESNYPKNAPKKFYRHTFPEYITFCCRKIK